MATKQILPPDELLQLIERFVEHKTVYRSGSYNETQVRREFIDKFFGFLGWDVDNQQGHAEQYKDVIHEDAIRVGGLTKAPDYCFRIGGTRKFFVEAKKPSVNIKDDISAAYQVRRYAWSAKLPLSILTDFEEFAVYDCRKRPERGDTAATGRILYITHAEYEKRWEEIASRFSKDAILRGAFDKFAETTKGKRGTTEVDTAFLSEIESWRDVLAHHLALRNPISQRELNFSVQRTIDRIIFLRICEDRGIEPYGQLQGLINGVNTYKRLCEIFDRADDRYNSGLFHFHSEKGRSEAPDELAKKLLIDDKVLKDILKRLYYPDSPYEFSVLPADILGQVYEQFLGKVIRLTAGHQAKVEEKPEVKKAGGVYYTPTYIVDYIVRHTVGKLLEGKSPKSACELKILDPACGSGSFLIGAYQYILDWHLNYYLENDPEKYAKGKTPELVQTNAGWKLTTAERKRILINNIYGVDIDSQAVEVTKLSLLLKVLEGETDASLNTQMSMFRERALPDLGSNIKCGNSLIGPDYYEGHQLSLLDDEEEMYRVNVFDWNSHIDGFGKIMKSGGFDAVIGNPPYGAWFTSQEGTYFTKHYDVFSGARDVYACFLEKGLNMTNPKDGKLSYIVPSAWLGGPDYVALRHRLLRERMEYLVLLPFDVFSSAYIDTAIVVIAAQPRKAEDIVCTYTYAKHDKITTMSLIDSDYGMLAQREWLDIPDYKFVLDPGGLRLLHRLHTECNRVFGDVALIKRGVLFDKSLLTDAPTTDRSHPYFEGDVYRYQTRLVLDKWIEFGDEMKERPKEFKWFEGTRILLRRLVNRRQQMMASLANDTFITNKNLYTVIPNVNNTDIRLLLSILNSSLMSFLYISQVTQAQKDDFPQVTIKDVVSLPFINLEAEGTSASSTIIRLTDQMLDMNKRLTAANVEQEITVLKRQIEATDRQIDALVYELYGLTEEEIALVEKQ